MLFGGVLPRVGWGRRPLEEKHGGRVVHRKEDGAPDERTRALGKRSRETEVFVYPFDCSQRSDPLRVGALISVGLPGAPVPPLCPVFQASRAKREHSLGVGQSVVHTELNEEAPAGLGWDPFTGNGNRCRVCGNRVKGGRGHVSETQVKVAGVPTSNAQRAAVVSLDAHDICWFQWQQIIANAPRSAAGSSRLSDASRNELHA